MILYWHITFYNTNPYFYYVNQVLKKFLFYAILLKDSSPEILSNKNSTKCDYFSGDKQFITLKERDYWQFFFKLLLLFSIQKEFFQMTF